MKEEVNDGETSVRTNGSGGSIAKTVEAANATETSDDGKTTRDLTWTTTVTVPSGGIDAGTVLYDYLGVYSGETTVESASNTDQWFTYDQIVSFFETYIDEGITIASADSKTVTVGYYNSDSETGFKIYACYSTDGWNTSGWIEYSDLISEEGKTAYSGILFTAYKIEFVSAVDISDFDGIGTFSLEYTTTADISDVENNVTTSQTYYNTVQINSLKANAQYTEYKHVYKTDGYNNSNDTTVTFDSSSSSGTLTWKVHVLAPYNSSEDEDGETETSTDLVITDTLPSGVTPSSVSVQLGSIGTVYLTTSWTDGSDPTEGGTLSGTYGGEYTIEGTVEYIEASNEAVGYYVIKVKIPSELYNSVYRSAQENSWSDAYITVTYVCTIDNYAEVASNKESDNTTYTWSAFKNSATVSWKDSDYGEDDQSQTPTYVYSDDGEETEFDHNSVIKGGTYSTSVGQLQYTVVLNLDEDDLLENVGYLTFTDFIDIYNYHGSDPIVLELLTVDFYQLYKLTPYDYNDDGTVKTYTYTIGEEIYYVDADGITDDTQLKSTGGYYAYTESDYMTKTYYRYELADIAWTFSEEDSIMSWDTSVTESVYTITATIPDGTAFIVYYSYEISGLTPGEIVKVENKANLTGDSNGGDSSYTYKTYEEPTVLGWGTAQGGGITIYKVDSQNYSTTLSDAAFTLEKWNSTTEGWEEVNYEENEPELDLTTDESGIISVYHSYANGSDDDGETVYAYYSWYTPYTLYRLVETTAPTGYIIDSSYLYFYWTDTEDWTDSDNNEWEEENTAVSQPEDFADYAYNLSDASRSIYVSNAPITTFTLKKVNTNDHDQTLSGAEFYLYEYEGLNSNKEEVWKFLGSYVTDDKGEINITFDEEVYSLDTAYMLKEVSAPDGYNAAYGDYISFYFYWDEDDPDTEGIYPTGWGTADDDDGYSYATAANIASQNTTVEATNTKTNTSVSVTKVWLDANGNKVTDPNYSATVQLYYYLSTEPSSSSSGSSSLSGDYETVILKTRDVSGSIPSNDSITWGVMTFYADIQTNLLGSLVSGTYLQVTVERASSIGDLAVYLQTTTKDASGTDTGYPVIATLSVPSYIEYNDDGTWTVLYSYDYINSMLKSGYKISDVTGLYVMNASSGGTITNFSVVSFYEVANADSTSKTLSGSYQSFGSTVLTGSTNANYLQTDGAVIRVTYSVSATSANYPTIQVGLQSYNNGTSNTDTNVSETVSVTNGSAQLLVPVSNLANINSFDWTYYNGIFTNSYGLTGEITSVEILIPYTSSSSSSSTTTVTTTETLLELTSTEGTLVSAWYENSTNILASYQNTKETYYTLKTLLQSNTEAYIELVVDGSSSLYLLIQYNMSSYEEYKNNQFPTDTVTGTYTVNDNGNYVYRFLASDILSAIESSSYSNDYQLAISGLSGDDTATLISAAVKVDKETSVANTSVDANYYVTLYSWTLSGEDTITEDDGSETAVGNLTSSTSGSYYWNVISTWEDDNANIRALLDAIYADTTSRVYVTVAATDESTINNLSNLELIIQGDTSVGSEGYDTILSIKPYMVIDNENKTYTLVYRSSQIKSLLSTAEAKYADAASVYADYLKLILSFASNGDYSATLQSINVITTNKLSLSSTYSRSYLTGESTAHYLYTADNGTGSYTLNSFNNWTVTVTDLPMSFTGDDGVVYYYYYYFVETGYSGGSTAYTTTYSQVDGENTGGEIIITNIENSYVLPSAGGMGDYTILYEFGVMLILIALCGAGIYQDISRLRKSLVEDPRREGVNPGGNPERLPDVRNRKFVIPRTARKGDTRAGPDG